MEENRFLRDQLALKKDNKVDPLLLPINNLLQYDPEGTLSTLNPSSQIISVGDAKAVSLSTTAPIIASSLMSSIIIYFILTLLLIAIIWIVIGKKIWNIWNAKLKEKSDQYIQTSDLHLWTYLGPGYMIEGQKFKDRN